MSEIKGTNIVGAITPFTTDDTYPTHYAKYGHGGYRTVGTIDKMNSIPEARCENGMLVYVETEDRIYKYNDTDKKFYELALGGSYMLPKTVYTSIDKTNPDNPILTAYGFDDIKTPGVYFLGAGYNQSPGILHVVSANDKNEFVFQTYISFLFADCKFNRTYTESNWSEWEFSLDETGTCGEYTGGTNIDIKDNVISAKGYVFNATINSFAEGESTTASGAYSHAEGLDSKAEGAYSHAEGNATTASGGCSHAEGSWTTASGDYSHAEGLDSKAEGAYSHAEGEGSTATGKQSHAEGAFTTASGAYSHAEGFSTQTGASAAHAEGNYTVANGLNSHAEGEGTITKNNGEHAEGRYNISHDSTISSIGIGNNVNSRFNAVEVSNKGDVYITGLGEYIGGTSGDPDSNQNILSLQDVISNIQEEITDIVENPSNPAIYYGGNNITINNNTITAKGYSYSYQDGMHIDNHCDVRGFLTVNAEFTSYGYSTFKDNITVKNPSTNSTVVSIDARSGQISATNGFYETSDIRKKNVIDELPLDKAYELINNCQSIIYTLKDSTDKQQIGLIAQEVQQYFPEVVSEDKDGYLSLDYAKLTSVIFRVLKDVIDRLNRLENK